MRFSQLAVLLLPVQDPVPAPPSPFDRILPIEIAAADPVLEGHGPSKRVGHTAEFSGTLHVWTTVAGDIDTYLRVEAASGTVLAEDDDGGGKPTPYLRIDVEPGTSLAIAVALSQPNGPERTEGSQVELHLVAAAETEATRTEAEHARAELAEIRRLREERNLDAARERAVALVERITTIANGSELLAAVAGLIGRETRALSLLRPTEAVSRIEVAHGLRTLPPEHPDLLKKRANLASALQALGDYPAARAIEEDVLAIQERRLTGDDPDLAAARGNLAVTLKAQGDLAAARALEEAVLAARERTLPEDHPDLQRARGNLANTLRKMGELRSARQLEERVLATRERTLAEDHPDVLRARTNLAVTLNQLGELERARDLLGGVLAIRARTLPEDHPDLTTTQLNLAMTLQTLGELPAARNLQETVLAVRERTLPEEHPDIVRARQGLALTLWMLGDLPAARAAFERVVDVLERTLPEGDPNTGAARMNFASVLGALGDLEAERAIEERVVADLEHTLPAGHPDVATARLNLAGTRWSLGDLAGARAIQEPVLAELERALPPDHPELSRARLGLANTLQTLGDLESARALYERALEVANRTLPPDHPARGTAIANVIAILAERAARTDAAAQAGLEEAGQGGSRAHVRLVREHFAFLRSSTRAALLDGSMREAEARLAAHIEDIGLALSEAEGFGVLDPDPELGREAFLFSETCRSAALTGPRLAGEAGADPALEPLRERSRLATDELAGLAQKGASATELDRARAGLDVAERELVLEATRRLGSGAVLEPDLDVLARALGPRDAVVAWRRYTRHRVARGATPAWSSLDSLCAFVLRRGPPDGREHGPAPVPSLARVELGPFAPVEEAVAAWRTSIGSTDGRGLGVGLLPESGVDARGEDLGRLVLDPLRPELADVERILVVTDDVLHLVPLDALPAGALARAGENPRTTLLGDVFSVEMRSTLIELGREHPPATGDNVLVALGGAAFGTVPGTPAAGILRGTPNEGGFAPIPATLAEVHAIAANFRESFPGGGRAVVLVEDEASCPSLQALAGSARVLHVATHGWYAPDSIRSFDDRAPDQAATRARESLLVRESPEERVSGMSPMLLCGLALAGANHQSDPLGRAPGLITAQEIAALDLSNCDLAVLSACETHAGKLSRAGQGVASLQKALQMAGARSVITSLWKVPDEATRELMLDFYGRLWIGKLPKARALWEAKTKLREARDESGKPKYSTRDWGAWVLTGEPD